MTHGLVAAGDRKTAEAAAETLKSGGNAFDAAVAAAVMCPVSEPVLASMAGGGFLMAAPAGRDPVVHDFFCQTPSKVPDRSRIDFTETVVDFGTVHQEFHHGAGSVAVPGMPFGLAAIHEDFCRLPFRRLIEPAVDAARHGLALSDLQAYILNAVRPIFLATEGSRALFQNRRSGSGTAVAGDVLAFPAYADLLEQFAAEGEALFRTGEVGRALDRYLRENGGCFGLEELARYRVERRQPREFNLGKHRLWSNPPPSMGGSLIEFTLDIIDLANGTPPDALTIAEALRLTSDARHQSGMAGADYLNGMVTLSESAFRDRYRQRLARKSGGTTHISIVDEEGNAAALTLSNGEGAGHVLPGTDIMLNNMLGEEDTNPAGFFEWAPDTRICSMMSPTILRGTDGAVTAIGSGGSNRIRSAIAQVICHLVASGQAPRQAIDHSRLHFERGLLSIEGGFAPEDVASLTEQFENCQVWDDISFFFGGVHVARFDPGNGNFSGGADPRRGGTVLQV